MELRTLFTFSIEPLSGDALIAALKSSGFPDATTSPANWKTGQGECSISYLPADPYIKLSDTTDDTGGRVVVIDADDRLGPNAVQVVVEMVESEVGASEVVGY